MKHFKYRRTPHLPFSPGISSDDIELDSLNHFVGKQIVITEKMDGENSTLYADHYHARSLDSRHHPSRDWLKAFWGNLSWSIPANWRICGENMYAKHSIAYENLESYFYGFSIWNEDNVAVSWDETLFWFEEFGIVPVPVLYKGPFNLNSIKSVIANLDLDKQEGIVLRVVDQIPYDNFEHCIAKWVRPKHVTTDEHWMHAEIIPNKLKAKNE